MFSPSKALLRDVYIVLGITTVICLLLGGCVLALRRVNRTAKIERECRQQLKRIYFAAYFWADDRSNFMPRTFREFKGRLGWPVALICQAAPNTQREMQGLISWSSFDERSSSYEILHPGIAASNEHALYLRCKVHDRFAYVDGRIASRYDATNKLVGLGYERPPEPARTIPRR